MDPDTPAPAVVTSAARLDGAVGHAPTVRIDGDPSPAGGAAARRDESVPGATTRVDAPDAVVPAGGAARAGDGSVHETSRVTGDVVSAGRSDTAPKSVRPGGTVVLPSGTYRVERPLGRPSGEAEVFLVEGDGGRFAFKLYYPHVRPNLRVLALLKETRHPNVIAVLDYGSYGGRTYELLEFAAGGSLADGADGGGAVPLPVHDERRLRALVAAVVAGLDACHQAGLVHKDVKPDNLFALDVAGAHVKLADFGLAEVVEHASGKHVTVQNRTATYAAPEVYRTLTTGEEAGRVVLGREVDYYAFGVTLLYLWRGGDPFGGLGEFVVMNAKAEGNVPIPEDMPIALARLVRGLITVVPKRRWSAAEVRRWLNGEHVELHEDVHLTERQYPALDLGDVDDTGRPAVVRSPAELADVVLRDARRGAQYLYGGRIASWVEGVDVPLHTDIEHLVREEFPLGETAGQTERREKERAALHKLVYVLDARRPFRTHGGVACHTLKEIGDAVERERGPYLTALQDPLDPLYLFLEARKQWAMAERLRRVARQVTVRRAHSEERAFTEIVLHLQDWEALQYEGGAFRSPADVLAAPPALRARIARDLAEGDHTKPAQWLDRLLQGDPSWPPRLARWRALGRYDAVTLAYLLDPQAPFDFDGTPVFTPQELFDELVARLDLGRPQRELVDIDGAFVREADFWLLHYAHRPSASESALDKRRVCGYAEVLQQLLDAHAGDLSEEAEGVVRARLEALVESRFTPPASVPVRREGVFTLRRARPDHGLVRAFRQTLQEAHAVVDAENRKRARQAGTLKAKRTGWAAAGLATALVLPMAVGSALGALGPPALAAAVWGAGALGMSYGFLRAIARSHADEDETAMEARFVTLLVAAPLLSVFCLVAVGGALADGALGPGGALAALLAGLAGSWLGSYVLGHLTANAARRWRAASAAVAALPPPQRGLTDAEEERVIDETTRAWRPAAHPQPSPRA
jgi:hypothetical protein